MFIHLPPGFEAAAHARDILETILYEIRRRPQAAVTVVAVDDDRRFFVRALNELLHVAVMQVQRAGDMCRKVRTGVPDIDESAGALIELLLSLVNLNLRDLHGQHLLDGQLLSSSPASVHREKFRSAPVCDYPPGCYNSGLRD